MCEWLKTHMQTERRRHLSTAMERHETVLRTAIGAFAAPGYFGTTTEVAKAVGISQAYVYRLVPSKEPLPSPSSSAASSGSGRAWRPAPPRPRAVRPRG
jgi:AcrR family transcriptional regulator